MAPVVVACLVDLFDQDPAEAGAVYEQIACNLLAALELKRLDVTALGVLPDVDDLALDPPRAAFLREATQVGRVEAGVELERIIDRRHDHRAGLAVGTRESKLAGGLALGVEMIVGEIPSRTLPTHPVVHEADAVHVDTELPEWVEVTVARTQPVDEFDAELEGCVGLAHELVLVEPEHTVV